MLELYHNAGSTCSQKVRLALDAKGLDSTSHEIDLVGGGQHDPEYLELNPSHVDFLDAMDATLAESVTAWLPEPVLAMFRANGAAVRAEIEKASAAREST